MNLMKAIKRVNSRSQNIIVNLARIFIVAACVGSSFAQTLSIKSGSSIGATQGLTLVSPDEVPFTGTFWWILSDAQEHRRSDALSAA